MPPFSILRVSPKRLFGVLERIVYIQSKTKYKNVHHCFEVNHPRYYAEEWKSDPCGYYKHKIRASRRRKRGEKFGGGGIFPLHGGEPQFPDPSILSLHEISNVARVAAIQRFKNREFWRQMCEKVRSVRDLLDVKDVVMCLDCLVAVDYRHTDLLKLLTREIIDDIYKLNAEEIAAMLNAYGHFNCLHFPLVQTSNELLIALMYIHRDTHQYFNELCTPGSRHNLQLFIDEKEQNIEKKYPHEEKYKMNLEKEVKEEEEENGEEGEKKKTKEIEETDLTQEKELKIGRKNKKKETAGKEINGLLLLEGKDETKKMNKQVLLSRIKSISKKILQERNVGEWEDPNKLYSNDILISGSALALILNSYVKLDAYNEPFFICSVVYLHNILPSCTLDNMAACTSAYASFITYLCNNNTSVKIKEINKYKDLFNSFITATGEAITDPHRLLLDDDIRSKNLEDKNDLSSSSFSLMSGYLLSLSRICTIFNLPIQQSVYDAFLNKMLFLLEEEWNIHKQKLSIFDLSASSSSSSFSSSNVFSSLSSEKEDILKKKKNFFQDERLHPFPLLQKHPLLFMKKERTEGEGRGGSLAHNIIEGKEEEVKTTMEDEEEENSSENANQVPQSLYEKIKKENEFSKEGFCEYDPYLTYQRNQIASHIANALEAINKIWRLRVRLEKQKQKKLTTEEGNTHFSTESKNNEGGENLLPKAEEGENKHKSTEITDNQFEKRDIKKKNKKDGLTYVMCDWTDRNAYASLYKHIYLLHIEEKEEALLNRCISILGTAGVDGVATSSLSSLVEMLAICSLYKSHKEGNLIFPKSVKTTFLGEKPTTHNEDLNEKKKKMNNANDYKHHSEKTNSETKSKQIHEDTKKHVNNNEANESEGMKDIHTNKTRNNTATRKDQTAPSSVHTLCLCDGKIELNETQSKLFERTLKEIIKKFINFKSEDLYRIKLAVRSAHLQDPYLSFYLKNFSAHLKFSKLRNQMSLNGI